MAATVGQKSGFGFYVENIVEALRGLQSPHELVPVTTVQKNLRTPTRMLWDQMGLPLTALTKKLDMLFVPAFSAPRFTKPVVMTAHDVYGLAHPHAFSGFAKRYWTHTLPQSMKRAERLLCISEHTKKEVMIYLQIPEERLTVIPLAAAQAFRVLEDVPAIQRELDTLKVETPFILTVATLEPRKNIQRLLEAFAFAQRENVKLVVVGKKGWEYHNIFETVRKYHLQNAVQFLDYTSGEQLVALYNACLFYVMPSIYEGFGLPALEALQCGAPVAVAQNTSLPEVVGDAGVLFDPFDVDSIRARLDLLLTDADMRNELQRKAVQRAKQFSWRSTAEHTMKAFEEVVG